MKRTAPALMALLALAATMGLAPIALAQADGADGEVRPGEQFAGAVGVQDAELEGEIDDRAFGLQVANATDDDERAAVVAERLSVAERRLGELERRASDLEERRENGNVSEGRYRAEIARIAAERASVERSLDRSDAVASDVPPTVLERQGVNRTAIGTLRSRASDLGGPEVAEAARSIAGPDVGAPVAAGRENAPADRGPGGVNATPGDSAAPDNPETSDSEVPDSGRLDPNDPNRSGESVPGERDQNESVPFVPEGSGASDDTDGGSGEERADAGGNDEAESDASPGQAFGSQ